MLDLLKPRGPDGAVLHQQEEGPRPYAFGVRQLAVGGLPTTPEVARAADPANVLVFDGQIFNRDAVRAFITGSGRQLRGTGDGELFLHLYELEGASGFRRVDG